MTRHPLLGAAFSTADRVDFVVVGSGAAGGVMARQLARAGFSVVVLEQGPYLTEKDFRHDELAANWQAALTNDQRQQPNTYRKTAAERALPRPAVVYGRVVGGGTTHFTGNYWRFHEIDFIEHSKRGGVPGAAVADWPISYAELEPYYSQAEWEIGVSGLAGAGPFDPPRSKPYPLPPLPAKSTGRLLEKAAQKMGWTAFPAPTAIISQPYRGRSPCVHCEFCEGYGCEMRAKSSTLVTMIPEAVATGRCEIRPLSYVSRVETDQRGRVTGVNYFDRDRREQFQPAKAVVLSANGAETPRLLLLSTSPRFPHGLGNGSGLVGTHLMFNGLGLAMGLFPGQINGYKGNVVTRIIHDTYQLDPTLGLWGGGGFDFRQDFGPILFALGGLPPDLPRWGSGYKKALAEYFTRSVMAMGHSTSLPVASNSVSLDPDHKDAWGLPAIRVTFKEHPNDLALYRYFRDRGKDLLDAAGATKTWELPITEEAQGGQPHLLGTCRMGNDPKTSVVNTDHRSHEVPNLFLVDGSSFVSGGRGQPTLTIQALAFRAADRITALARRGELGG